MGKCPVCGMEFKKKRWNQRYCSKQCQGVALQKKCGSKDTLCWYCKNTNAFDCPWFGKNEEPVPGWKATPSTVKYKGQEKPSYRVHECPLFEPEYPLFESGRR